MEKIKVYTIDGCPFCTQLKDLLTKEGIEFKEVNVNLPENEAEYNKLHVVTKSDEVPIIRVGKQLLVPNVSYNSIIEAVNLTKKFLA